MGRSKVISNYGEGRYLLEAVYDESYRSEERGRLDAAIEELEPQVTELSDALDTAKQERIDAANAVETAGMAYLEAYWEWSQVPEGERGDPPDRSEVLEAEIAAERALMRERGARISLSQVLGEIEALHGAIDVLETSGAPRQFEAWCADYSPDIPVGSEVATLELTGEPQGTVVVAPGGRSWSDQDGVEWPVGWMRPHQTYLNLALLPGVQRHRPMYREGVIGAVYLDGTCSVELTSQGSSQQGLLISPEGKTYIGAPISYMGITDPDDLQKLFVYGDRVVLEFDGDWGLPQVIGFVTNPKKIGGSVLFYVLSRDQIHKVELDGNLAAKGVESVQHNSGDYRPGGIVADKDHVFAVYQNDANILVEKRLAYDLSLIDSTNFDDNWGSPRIYTASQAAGGVFFDTRYGHARVDKETLSVQQFEAPFDNEEEDRYWGIDDAYWSHAHGDTAYVQYRRRWGDGLDGNNGIIISEIDGATGQIQNTIMDSHPDGEYYTHGVVANDTGVYWGFTTTGEALHIRSKDGQSAALSTTWAGDVLAATENYFLWRDFDTAEVWCFDQTISLVGTIPEYSSNSIGHGVSNDRFVSVYWETVTAWKITDSGLELLSESEIIDGIWYVFDSSIVE